MVYYNEIEPYCVQWLKNLIEEDLIAKGVVDDRPIQEVRASDLYGFKQCHFFAGIGGWSYACRLAGLSDDREIWTGSCPCQPFSVAGLHKGTSDERHLWPEFYRLILECKPSIIFGEQVASKAARGWLSNIFSDLENAGYAAAGADLCAASVKANHIRQRIYWCADSIREGWERPKQDNGTPIGEETTPAVNDNCFARARSAVEGDISDLLSDYGVSIAVERSRIKGYGNAIVPQVAAEFISSFMECL